ncbi:nucleotidyltransferase family protein [Nitratifractor sp.]
MKRETVLHILRKNKEALSRRYGIEAIALFGSTARDDGTDGSDIDLVILRSRSKDYFKRAEAKYFLERQLGKKVDLGYFDSIRPVIRKRIENDLIYV